MELFGELSIKVVKKELQQIHGIEIYISMDSKKLTKKEQLGASSALMFQVEKDDQITSRKCVVSTSKQHAFEGYNMT